MCPAVRKGSGVRSPGFGVRRPGSGVRGPASGTRVCCVCLCISRKYHFMSMEQMNLSSPSHSATDSPSFIQTVSWTALCSSRTRCRRLSLKLLSFQYLAQKLLLVVNATVLSETSLHCCQTPRYHVFQKTTVLGCTAATIWTFTMYRCGSCLVSSYYTQ